MVIVPVSATLLCEMMREGWSSDKVKWKCVKGLPETAEFVDMFEDRVRYPNTVCLVFKDDSFDEVYEGSVLPEFGCIYETVIE
jgi:hypothetical protein